MNFIHAEHVVEFRHFHFFCGLGGGKKGFNKAKARVGNLRGRWRCIGGIDVDGGAIRDFNAISGAPGTLIDLFDEDQYRAFHGAAPPAGWRPAGTEDIRRAAHGERPHCVFLSAPCKGFSGLLPEKSSASAKYQALNGLTLRGVWLMLEAWKDDPPELIVFENVPRIMTRGRHLLDQIVALLRSYGYAVAETTHDCGVIGGLGQSRKRFLLVARHEMKVPPFLYEPEKRRLRGVGEILERLPLPGDALGGPMHRVPSLQWKTWVRLAFVEAGSDWRSLNKLTVEDGVLRDFGILPDYSFEGTGILGVKRWDQPAGTIGGRGLPTNGAYSVADPRPNNFAEDRSGLLGVRAWQQPAPTITSQRSPGQGRFSVADPRVDGHEKSVQLGVRPWERPAGVVTGKMFVGGGPNSVADPRIEGKPRFNNTFRIVPWAGHSPAVAGPGGPAGGLAVADPRTGYGDGAHQNILAVTDWERHAKTVAGAKHVAGGALSVADPRTGASEESRFKHSYRVTDWVDPAGTVTSAHSPSNGAAVVADPRPTHGPNAHQNKMAVLDWEQPSKTVTGSDRVGSGALSVADPRPAAFKDGRKHFEGGGHYGVVPWLSPSKTVSASANLDNGYLSVADPREAEPEPLFALPQPNDRLVAVIRALDGTWHRPFTTLELAALQSLVDPDEISEGFCLDGQSDSAWRERIGNAVPPDAAEAIAGVMATTLLLAMSGETFMLSSQPIWVQPVAMALAVDQRGNDPEATG